MLNTLKLKDKFSKVLMNPIIYNDLMITFIEIDNVQYDSNWTCRSHKHPWYEFHYLSDGALYTTIEGVEFKVESGYFYLMPPGCTHSHRHFEDVGNTGLLLRWILEKNDTPNKSSSRGTADRIINSLSKFNSQCFFYPADTIINEVKDNSIEEMETALIYWLMNIYHKIHTFDGSEQNIQSVNSKNITVKQIVLYLEKEYSSDIDVQSIAFSIGYSYRHLSRIFLESTGMTIVEKLNSIRISKAIELLEHTNLSVGDICAAVGFRNKAYFSTEFARYTHYSPTQFRKMYKNTKYTPL